MSENIENLLLEHMKRFQAGQDRIENKLTELIVRVSSLETHVALLHGDLAGLNVRMDNFSKRIERIERRLDLADAT